MVKLRYTLAAAALAMCVLTVANAQPPGGRGKGGQDRRGGGGFGMMQGRMGGVTSMALLTNTGVQQELKLTDEQKTKFKEYAATQREKMREAAGGRDNFDREKFQEAMKEAAEKADKMVKDTLKPEQVTRLNQIKWQQMGIAAFSEKDVQDKLKISDDQKEKFKNISQEMAADMREIAQNAGGNREEMREKMEALRKESTEKANKALTSDQQKQFKEMLGAKFDYKPENPFGGEGGGRGERGKGGKGGERKGKGDGTPPKRGDG